MQSLQREIALRARSANLLVAADFDGTLSPIVDDPAMARPNAQSLATLRAIAALPDTCAAIVSGRSLADLAARLGDAGRIHLIGSHGSECSTGQPNPPSKSAFQALVSAQQYIQQLAARTPGAIIETKPVGCAFHYRRASDTDGAAAVNDLLAAARQWPDLQLRHGKKVIEFNAIRADKGSALASLRTHLGASTVLYVGDDVTDEDVFQTLSPGDVSIKVGDGPTCARHRLADTNAVSQMLAQVLTTRRSWRHSSSTFSSRWL